MYTKNQGGSFFSTRNIIIIACAAMLVFLVAVAVVVAVMGDTGNMADRDGIENKLEELGDADLGHSYVASHLCEYGIGGFDAARLRRVELYFRDSSIYELPSVSEMAYKIAQLYLEYYYDKVDKADTEAVTTSLLRCFTEATGDKYAVYRTAAELKDFDDDMSGTFIGIGVSVMQKLDPTSGMLEEVSIEEVFGGSGADDAGIIAGDLIVAVDGRPLSEFDGNTLVRAIRGEEGTTVRITVERDGERIDFVCERRTVVDMSVRYSIDGGIGYIEISSFKLNTPTLFAEAIAAAKTAGVSGIVFDLRDNPGGYLDSVVDVIDMLVPTAGVRLASYVDVSGYETLYSSTGSGISLDVPVSVICNENTASAGELFTAAMRDFADMGIIDATVVGTQTYGKGVMQNTYTLFDKSSITLTTAFYNPPSNKNYDGVGVIPDIKAEAGAEGRDNQLEVAIETLKGGVTNGPNSSI